MGPELGPVSLGVCGGGSALGSISSFTTWEWSGERGAGGVHICSSLSVSSGLREKATPRSRAPLPLCRLPASPPAVGALAPRPGYSPSFSPVSEPRPPLPGSHCVCHAALPWSFLDRAAKHAHWVTWHLLAVCPWTSYLPSLCLGFFWKIRITMLPDSQGPCAV